MEEETTLCHSLEDLFRVAKLVDVFEPFKGLTGADDLNDVLESTDEVSHSRQHVQPPPR